MKFTGDHLRFLRTIRKLKQPALALKLGVKQQAVSKMENKEELEDIADFDAAILDKSKKIPWSDVKKELGLK